jgi:Glycosyl transferase family 2
MTPEVSILLPTHDRADVLGYAIRSVLSQTVDDFELLIVGDGCTDATRDVVGRFNDPRIKWFDLPKAPLSGYANRNVALRQAVGRVVAYAQDDDLWFPDHLELLLEALARADVEWAYSRPLWVGPDGVICPSAFDLTLPDELDDFLHRENHIPSTCVIHLRAALDRVGYWPEDQARLADWVCWRRMICSAAKPTAGYCRVPTNLHFRAIWRDFDSLPESAWRPLAPEPWWPTALIHAPSGEPQQAVLWEAMAEGSDWTNLVRDATEAALDRMAWNAMRHLLPGIARARAETHAASLATEQAQAALQQAGDAAANRVAELEAQRDSALRKARQAETVAAVAADQAERDHRALQSILTSRMWRAMAPMRAATDALKQMAWRSTRGRAHR